MTRASLPTQSMAITDAENSATVQFNAWLSGVDSAVIAGSLGIGRREPLPPGGIVVARAPTIPFAKWLLWVDRSILSLNGKRQPLFIANPIIGGDLKSTIPYYAWCRYVDLTLP